MLAYLLKYDATLMVCAAAGKASYGIGRAHGARECRHRERRPAVSRERGPPSTGVSLDIWPHIRQLP
jgi:hypothetical protein